MRGNVGFGYQLDSGRTARLTPRDMEEMVVALQFYLKEEDCWNKWDEWDINKSRTKGPPPAGLIEWVGARLAAADIVLWSLEIFRDCVVQSAEKLRGRTVSFDSWPDRDQFWIFDEGLPLKWPESPQLGIPAIYFLKSGNDEGVFGMFCGSDEGMGIAAGLVNLADALGQTVAWIPTGNAFLQSTIVSTWKAKIKKRHKLTKQEKRLGMKKKKAQLVHKVKVVRLRKIVRPVRPSNGQPGSSREYSCRWYVRGHLRNQPYPSLGVVRPLWINGYVKGPEDKPLKDPAKIVYYANR